MKAIESLLSLHSDIKEMRLNRLTLSFTGETAVLEAPFQAYFITHNLLQIRVALFMGALMYGFFGILDALLLPEQKNVLWLIRYAFVCPVILAVMATTYFSKMHRYLQPIMSFLIGFGGLGIVLMIIIAPTPISYYYYAGLILIFMFGYSFIYLRFLWASLSGWFIVIIYEITAVLINTPTIEMTSNSFFLVSGNLAGMLVGYTIEYASRRNYFLMQLLAREELRIKETNDQLERRVAERTNSLEEVNSTLIKEITNRKNVEQALRESKERYQMLFDKSPLGVFTYDSELRLTECNDRYPSIMKTSKDRLVGLDLTKLVDQRAIPLLRMPLEGRQSTFEGLYQATLSNTEVWISASAAPLYDGTGNIVGGMVIVDDITERKQAEGSLHESEERLRLIAENAKVVIWMMDMNLRYTYISPYIKHNLDYTPEEYVLKPLHEVLTPSSLDLCMQLFAEELEEEKNPDRNLSRSRTVEVEHIHRDGNIIWAELNMTFIRDSAGNALGILGITSDITERNLAEEKRRELVERLQRAEKMEALGTLAGGVAHDLNNVLGVLVGYSELLAEKLPLESPLRRYADNILQSGIRGAAIIQDLLTLARRGVSVSEVIDLNRVIRDYLKTPEFESLKDHHWQVRFSTDLEGGLLNIQGSPVHLSKAIMNLVSNAAESISGKGKVTIQTRNRYLDQPIRGYDEMQEGDYVVLTVSDTGMGISAEDLGKIFEPFYTKKVMGRSGTGLGLAVVWGTVKDHDGYIDVQSEAGKGSVFTLYFPVTREKAAEAEQVVSFAAYMGTGESILVVDDVQEQRELAVSMLERLGYRVEVVSGGEEAVERLKRRKADLVVLDMIMDPGIDGMETYRRILEMNPGQKAVIVSGFSETDRVRKTREMGAGAFVRKPYIMEKIGLAVRKELDRK